MLARLESRHGWTLAGILVVALILRLAALGLESGYEPVYDSADYDRHARSIAFGNGYPESAITADGGPSAFRPPLYPYLLGGVYTLAGAGAGVEVARVFGALLGVAILAGMYLLGREIWGVRAGLLAAGLGAIFPPLVFLHLALISEPLFVTLELGVVLAALASRRASGDWRWALAAGVLCGLAALTRSNGALLAIPAAIGVWVVRPRLSPAGLVAPAAVLTGLALTLVPWTVRNAIEFDHFVPTNTQTGFGLAGAFNDGARDVGGYTATWVLPTDVSGYGELFAREELDERELDAELRGRAMDYVFEHPGFVAEGAVLNFLRTFQALGQEPESALADRAQLGLGERTAPIVKWSVRVVDVLALVAIILIVIRAPGSLRPWFVWLAPALAVLAAVWVLGSTRYAIPAFPFMILLLAIAAIVATGGPLKDGERYRPG